VITLIAFIRASHLAALALLVGTFVFLLVVARPAFRKAEAELEAERAALDRTVIRLSAWSLVVAILTALAWLWMQTALVTGRPVTEVLDALGGVLTGTQFGRVQHAALRPPRDPGRVPAAA
jgi:hypothetical protein